MQEHFLCEQTKSYLILWPCEVDGTFTPAHPQFDRCHANVWDPQVGDSCSRNNSAYFNAPFSCIKQTLLFTSSYRNMQHLYPKGVEIFSFIGTTPTNSCTQYSNAPSWCCIGLCLWYTHIHLCWAKFHISLSWFIKLTMVLSKSFWGSQVELVVLQLALDNY